MSFVDIGPIGKYTPGTNHLEKIYKDIELDEDVKHYVVWSGGCDSSVLLYELLSLYGSKKVVAISYNYPWLYNKKAQSEEMHRNAFISKIKLHGNNFMDFSHTIFTVNQETKSGDPLNVKDYPGIPQALAWMFSTPMYLNYNGIVYIGMIKGDNFSLWIDDYYRMFNNINSLLHKKSSLRIPYITLEKKNIIEKLFYYDLYNETWYCEFPNFVNMPCGKCVPCIKHRGALADLLYTTNDDFIKYRARQELDKIEKYILDAT